VKKTLFFSLALIGEIGFATAIPLVIFSKLGEYLDLKYGTGNRYFYLGIVLAVIQGFYYVYLIAKRAIKIMEEIIKEEEKK
jgi:hypothetical protein